MITDAILSALLDAFTAVLSAIPDLALPSQVDGAVDEFASAIGGALGGLDAILPVHEVAVWVAWVLVTYLPVRVTFEIARWTYEHLPVVGNGG